MAVAALVATACGPRFPNGSAASVAAVPGGHRLTWPAAVEHDEGQRVAGYRVEVDGAVVAELAADERSCLLTGLPVGPHEVAVTAFDDIDEPSTHWAGLPGRLPVTVSATRAPVGPPSCTPGSVRPLERSIDSVVELTADGTSVIEDPDGPEVVVRDLATGATDAIPPVVWTAVPSSDGRWFAFSTGDALVSADEDEDFDVYLYDRVTQGYELVSDDHEGIAAVFPSISADGSAVLYTSKLDSPELGGTHRFQLRRWQRAQGTIDVGGPGLTFGFGLSGDGSVVAWERSADGEAQLVVSHDGGPPVQLASRSILDRSVSVSADGAAVVFAADPDDVAGQEPQPGHGIEVFRYDVATGTIERLTTGASGLLRPEVTADGGEVWFSTEAALVSDDDDATSDLYRWRAGHGLELQLPGADGAQTLEQVSADGRTVLLSSTATNLAAGDTDPDRDAYLWVRPGT
jgi:Tol biopolymer transport system component